MGMQAAAGVGGVAMRQQWGADGGKTRGMGLVVSWVYKGRRGGNLKE
jgi:hypothetical protein